MDKFAQELSDKLGEIYRNVTRLEENALREGNIHLTLAETHLVSLLSRHREGITVGEIAETMTVSRPTATVAVNKLVNKGYAQKENKEKDGRRVRVFLTAEGDRVSTLHKRCQRTVVSKLGNEFSPEQREILLRAIDKLNQYFEPISGKYALEKMECNPQKE